jgi:hypothetical protein
MGLFFFDNFIEAFFRLRQFTEVIMIFLKVVWVFEERGSHFWPVLDKEKLLKS